MLTGPGFDNGPRFEYHPWRANLRIFEIYKIESIPCKTISPFIERLTGTIRREYLDHTLARLSQVALILADFQKV